MIEFENNHDEVILGNPVMIDACQAGIPANGTPVPDRAKMAKVHLINHVSLPPVDRLLDGRNAFATTLTWPETQRRVQALFNRGLQQEGDLEHRFGAHLATLLE